MKYQPKVAKPKKVGTLERLAIPKPRKPRFLLRWSPTGRLFDQEGKLAASSNSESQYDCSNGDNACTYNAMEPKIKQFPNFTTLLDRLFDQDGKLVAPSNSESHVDCSNGDNACTSNAMEPKIKRFLNSTSLLGRLSRFVCGASTQVVPST
nr:hypothetical protein [Tanacetum cinerariifolium]